jgi:hypothetical protein
VARTTRRRRRLAEVDGRSFVKRCPRLFGSITHLFLQFRMFFAAVPGALKDHLNTEELIRIAITVATTGGGVFGFLNAVLQHAPVVFPAPADAALATALLAAILEAARRLRHGVEPPAQQAVSRFYR